MRNWEENTATIAHLSVGELFELIRDATTQGNLDAQRMKNTGRADLVASDLENSRGLPPIQQING